MLTEDEFRDQLRSMADADLSRMKRLIEFEEDRRDVCEHGVRTACWCEACNREYKRAAAEHEAETTKMIREPIPLQVLPPSTRD